MVDVRSAAVYSRSGHLLYVRDGSLVAHTFDTITGRLVGEPQVISDGVQYFAPTAITAFDVTRDGSRFVVVRSLPNPAPPSLTVVLNWETLLK